MNTSLRNICILSLTAFSVLLVSCSETRENKKVEKEDGRIKRLDDATVRKLAEQVDQSITPQLADGLTLKIWAIDSLVADPVSIDMDDHGNVYYTRTIRQKNSEFDIRGHQDWEIESMALQTIEDKRAFLRRVLSPENSDKNQWLRDVNGDGSRDWRDLTIEKEHVYRVSDESGDGLADVSQLVIEDFHDEVTDAAGGVLKYNDDLFVGIAPDLWRVRDTNNDGFADEKESLSHGYGIHIGFSGHGMSGLRVGPEGKIYWQIGDIGFNGTDKDGVKHEHPNSGVIVRANPDGSDFEVFAYGNRNTHEFVFDEYGNLISEDNDGDHAGESERLVYVVNGADIGWRINWQFGKYRDESNNTYKVWMDEKMYLPRWDGQAAYITPAIANYVNGPTGMLYNPGTALGPEYKNMFFVVEFVGNPSQSGIHGFRLKPKGATFELKETKKLLSGVLATGMDFGPDGAIYFSDWIEGWDTKNHGRIWKLDVASELSEQRQLVKSLLADDFKKYDLEKLGGLLKHDDMRIRQKAQFEIANRPEGMNVFLKALSQTQFQLARVHAIWGISQFARKDMQNAKHLVPLLKDNDPEIRAQAAKWIGDVRYKDAGEELLELLTDEYARARFFGAEALGRISYAKAVDPLIKLLEDNNDEDAYIRHAASLALARIGNADAVAALYTHPSQAVRTGAVIALRRMRHASIANFLNDKSEFVLTEAARAINDDLSIAGALPQLGDVLVKTSFKSEPLIRRAINANLRVGSPEAMKNLLTYASAPGNPVAMRVEAIAALSTWARPSLLDRVDGRHRGEIRRDPATLRTMASPTVIKLARESNVDVRTAAVKALGRMGEVNAVPLLMTILKGDVNTRVRETALRSISQVGGQPVGDAVKVALKDKDKVVRAFALDLLPETGLAPDVMATLLLDVINTRTIEEKQAAVTTLGTLPLSITQPVFDQLLRQFESKKLPLEISLELSEAIDKSNSKELRDKFRTVNRAVNTGTDTLKAAFASALAGGDIRRGERIFYQHQTAQCIRCHSYGDYGGSAGPRLNGVATRLSREQLLEALVEPSARIAPGYGTVTLELADGRKLNGILQEENAKSLRLKIGSRPDTTISVSSIAKKTYGGSSMPPMGLLLTKREIRDLVAFLSTIKE